MPWTFKLVSKTFVIHKHEGADVRYVWSILSESKFLGCINNQISLHMVLRLLTGLEITAGQQKMS